MSEALLSARQVAKSFDRNPVLGGVDLDVHPGEVVALLGENGAGKSTFVNIVSGSLQPSGGTLFWQGQEVRFRTAAEGIGAGIIHIHQELSIIPSLSVMENLYIGNYLAGRGGWIDRRKLAESARAVLARMDITHIDPRMEAGRLSVAEQQMLEIAKALVNNARLLILDEPTAALTPHEAGVLFRVVRSLKQRGVGVIFISHRLDEVFEIADRIVVLRDGRVVSTSDASGMTRQAVIADMTGRAFQGFRRTDREPSGRTVLEVDGLTDGRRVGPATFSLGAGEVLGIFGLVGSGRTELLDLLVGARKATSGTMKRSRGDGLFSSPGEAWRNGFAMLPEGRKSNGILPDLSVAENIAVAVRQNGGAVISPSQERAMAARSRSDLGIVAADMSQAIRRLSGGNQQKALLARCLVTKPEILLLDEPTHGVDVRTKADIYRMIEGLAAEGVGVIFVSSELPEVLSLASTVMVLSNGQPTLYTANKDLSESDVLAAAFARQ
ncbi:MAG: sugar ABC transporter ATP-binding protein [Shinella sp.]|nr:sugar ABC transporter ATP-binding protein [Shinella sp.]